MLTDRQDPEKKLERSYNTILETRDRMIIKYIIIGETIEGN